MLAQLQRFTTIGLLVAAATWAVWHFEAGRPAWAVGGALLIAGGYSLVLAAEFALMHRVNAHDPAPRASALQLLRAWWGEVHSAPRVFCWRQPFRSQVWPDHLPAVARGRRGLLLVHGFVCNRGLWNRWYRALRAHGIPHVALNLEPVFGAIDEYVDVIDAGVRRLEDATGVAPVVVAHSMGGLALRRWWVEPGNRERVHHAITIGSPHGGTWLARFAMSPNARQMQPGNRWLHGLMSREPAGHGARFTCFYGHCDNIVFPASTAVLPGAQAVHLAACAHVQMADHPEPLAEALRRVGVSRR